MILIQISDLVGEYAIAKTVADNTIIQAIIDKREKNCIYRLLGKELGDLLISYIQNPPSNITVGPLVVGNQYKIETYVAGDDFTNVATVTSGTINTSGCVFVATGITPTDYSHASTLSVKIPRFENILNTFYLERETWYYENDRFADSKGLKDLLLCEIFYYIIKGTQLRHTLAGVVSQSSENAQVLSSADSLRIAETKWNTDGLNSWFAIQWLCKINNPDLYPEYLGANEQTRAALW